MLSERAECAFREAPLAGESGRCRKRELLLQVTTSFMDSDELLSAEEVGRILKLSKSTVQRWCHGGKLPAVKMGKMYRVRKKDLDNWYEQKLLEQVAE